jgi:hypothetical protein
VSDKIKLGAYEFDILNVRREPIERVRMPLSGPEGELYARVEDQIKISQVVTVEGFEILMTAFSPESQLSITDHPLQFCFPRAITFHDVDNEDPDSSWGIGSHMGTALFDRDDVPSVSVLLEVREMPANIHRQQSIVVDSQMAYRKSVQPGYLVGYAELGEYIKGASLKTLRRWVKDGKIPHRRDSHKLIIFRITDVDNALRAMQAEESS